MPASDLYAKIQQHADDLLTAEPIDREAIRVRVNAATRTTKFSGRINNVKLMDKLTAEEAGVFFACLDTAAENSPYIFEVVSGLRGYGFDLSDPRSQAFIEQFRGDLGDALTDKVKGFGIQVKSVLETPATSDDIDKALLWAENQQRFSDAKNRASEAIENGATWAEVLTAFEGVAV